MGSVQFVVIAIIVFIVITRRAYLKIQQMQEPHDRLGWEPQTCKLNGSFWEIITPSLLESTGPVIIWENMKRLVSGNRSMCEFMLDISIVPLRVYFGAHPCPSQFCKMLKSCRCHMLTMIDFKHMVNECQGFVKSFVSSTVPFFVRIASKS